MRSSQKHRKSSIESSRQEPTSTFLHKDQRHDSRIVLLKKKAKWTTRNQWTHKSHRHLVIVPDSRQRATSWGHLLRKGITTSSWPLSRIRTMKAVDRCEGPLSICHYHVIIFATGKANHFYVWERSRIIFICRWDIVLYVGEIPRSGIRKGNGLYKQQHRHTMADILWLFLVKLSE